jgi:hypothetical protein
VILASGRLLESALTGGNQRPVWLFVLRQTDSGRANAKKRTPHRGDDIAGVANTGNAARDFGWWRRSNERFSKINVFAR